MFIKVVIHYNTLMSEFMLQHLSPKLFKERIADYEGADKWHFKNDIPTVIVFHSDKHLFAKGFRDVYDAVDPNFEKVKFYEVLTNHDPEIAEAYDIRSLPATMFLDAKGQPEIIQGYLTPEEVVEDVRKFCLKL